MGPFGNAPGEQDRPTVGLSAFAIHALTDLVYVDLPQLGRRSQAGKPFGEVESVKAVSDLYSPVDGQVVEVNSALTAQDQDGLRDISTCSRTTRTTAGWMVKIRVTGGQSELLDYETYKKQCDEAA